MGLRQSNRRPDDSKIAVQHDPHQRADQPDHRPKAMAELAAAQVHPQGIPRYTTLGLRPDRRPPHSSPPTHGIYAGYNRWLTPPPAGRYWDQTRLALFRPGSKNRSVGGPPVPARTSCQCFHARSMLAHQDRCEKCAQAGACAAIEIHLADLR